MAARSTVIYGTTGSTKTTQLYNVAKWLWTTYKLKSRLITGDPGGYAPFEDSGFIKNKITEVFDYTDRRLALADMRWLCQGYWPRETAEGKLLFKGDAGTENIDISAFMTTPEEFNGIGAYLFDGLSSIASGLLTHCSNQPQGTIGFKEAYAYEEEGEWIRGTQEGHYNIVQKEVRGLVNSAKKLPVKFIVWTALLGKGKEMKTKKMEYGPQLVGTAATSDVPSWFMDCLHMTREMVGEANASGEVVAKEKVVAWFKEHHDTDTEVKYLCKARCLPELIPEVERLWPFGFVEMGYTEGLDEYYKGLLKLNKKHRDKG